MQRTKWISWSAAITIAGALLACQDQDLPTIATITVNFPGTTSADPALLLYSGKEGSDCRSYKPNVANPSVTLPDVSYDPACDVEMDAFAPGRGTFATNIDPAIPSSSDWLTIAIATGTMSVTLPSLTPVPLQIWLVANTPGNILSAEAMRDRLLDKAYPVLETFGTGLTLDTASAMLNPASFPVHCNDSNAISTNPAIYDASRINVYFVQDYGGIPNLSPAQNCWQKAHPEIVFISWGNTNVPDPTLVHELSHALGLVHPGGPYGGHTFMVSGFDAYNLMATNTDVTNVTIGQLYALNFSSDSWLNRTGSPFVRPIVKVCQDSWGAGLCPALTLVQPGWPP